MSTIEATLYYETKSLSDLVGHRPYSGQVECGVPRQALVTDAQGNVIVWQNVPHIEVVVVVKKTV